MHSELHERTILFTDIEGSTRLWEQDREAMSRGLAQHDVRARGAVESNNGEFGRLAGVNFAEAYVRYRNETHDRFPVTRAAMEADPLTRHVAYSQVNLREAYPVS